MKNMIFFLTVLSLVVGCNSSKKKSSSSSSSLSPLCTQYPWSYGCPGYTTGTGTTGSTTVTTAGTTTGSTSGYTKIPSDNNWQSRYPSGTSFNDSCSTAFGGTGEIRAGTITVAGGTWYSPDNAWGSVGDSQYSSLSYTHNNSHYLVDVPSAAGFLDTDSKLRLRFQVRPEVNPPVGKTWCYNRTTGQASAPYGYGSLKFSVSLRGVDENGQFTTNLMGTKSVTVSTGQCSAPLDFTGLNQGHAGVVFVVHDVQSDQGCWYSGGCSAYTSVKTGTCWSMNVEAQVDGN